MAVYGCEDGTWEFCGKGPSEHCPKCKLYLCRDHRCNHLLDIIEILKSIRVTAENRRHLTYEECFEALGEIRELLERFQ